MCTLSRTSWTVVSEIPLQRCGQSLQLAQEMSERPLFWPGQRDEKRGEDRSNIKENEGDVTCKEGKWRRCRAGRVIRGMSESWAADRRTDWAGGFVVVRWLAVRPRGSWQARLHATCRKPRVIGVRLSTTTGKGLWHRKEIQYGAFIELQPAWESSMFKYSNGLACS